MHPRKPPTEASITKQFNQRCTTMQQKSWELVKYCFAEVAVFAKPFGSDHTRLLFCSTTNFLNLIAHTNALPAPDKTPDNFITRNDLLHAQAVGQAASIPALPSPSASRPTLSTFRVTKSRRRVRGTAARLLIDAPSPEVDEPPLNLKCQRISSLSSPQHPRLTRAVSQQRSPYPQDTPETVQTRSGSIASPRLPSIVTELNDVEQRNEDSGLFLGMSTESPPSEEARSESGAIHIELERSTSPETITNLAAQKAFISPPFSFKKFNNQKPRPFLFRSFGSKITKPSAPSSGTLLSRSVSDASTKPTSPFSKNRPMTRSQHAQVYNNDIDMT